MEKRYISPDAEESNILPLERSSEIVAEAAREIERRKLRTPKHQLTNVTMVAGMLEEQIHDDTLLVHGKHLQLDDLHGVLRIPRDPENAAVLVDQVNGIVRKLNTVADPNARVTRKVKGMLIEILTRLSDVLARKERDAKDTSQELPYEELAA